MLRTIVECIAGPSRLPLQPSAQAHGYTLVRGLHTSPPLLSGHNRWSKIRHKKGAVDAQRSAIFSRLTNEIHQAMKPPNSPDPASNARLATALLKARDGGVPKSGIENVLARARAAADGSGQVVMYEAVAAGGKAALVIECMTDNPTRTVSRVKELLNKHGGRMAPTSYLFERKGLITLEPTPSNPSPTLDSLLDLSLDLGVEDVRESHSTSEPDTEPASTETKTLTVTEFELVTPLNELSSISTALSSARNMEDWTIRSAEMSYEAVEPVEVVAEGEEGEGIKEERVESLVKLVDSLEIEQDITQVWTNLAR